MNELINIGTYDIFIKEYNGQRVVTFKDIDMVHERPDGTAKRNFNNNKEHFLEKEDFYFVKPADVQPYEIRTSEINNAGTYLITEQGYLMLVKSFTDNLAWDVQRKLVNGYFRLKHVNIIPTGKELMALALVEAQRTLMERDEVVKQLETEVNVKNQVIGELKPKADYTDRILKNPGLVTTTQIAKDYGMSAYEMNNKLHELKIQFKQSGQWLLYKEYHGMGYTHSETIDITRSDGTPDVRMNTKWTQKGRLFLYEKLKVDGVIPVIERECRKVG